MNGSNQLGRVIMIRLHFQQHGVAIAGLLWTLEEENAAITHRYKLGAHPGVYLNRDSPSQD